MPWDRMARFHPFWIVFPILIATVVERARPSERGSALAIFTALFDVGILFGGPSLGLLVQATSYGTMFLVSSVLAACTGVVFALWDRTTTMR